MAKDLYHETVKQALINDGWTITHDPLRVAFGTSAGYIDLGAERLIGATKVDKEDPERTLYLAVPSSVIEQLIDSKMMTYVKDAVGVKLISYSTVDTQLVEWIR